MRRTRFTNRAYSTLQGALTAAQTSVTVDSVADFPTEGDFFIAVGNEMMKVTGVSGSVFTVERGKDDNLPVAHADGEYVFAVISRDQMNEFGHELYPFGSYAYGNTIRDANGAFLDSTDFTNYNFTGSSKTDDGAGSIVVNADDGSFGVNWAIISRSQPATPYTLIAHVLLGPGGNYGDNSLAMQVGVGFHDTSGSSLLMAHITEKYVVEASYHSSYTASASSLGTLDWVGKDVWLKLTNDGTTLEILASANGSNWSSVATDTVGDNLTPDRICFAVNSPEATSAQIPAVLLGWHEIT